MRGDRGIGGQKAQEARTSAVGLGSQNSAEVSAGKQGCKCGEKSRCARSECIKITGHRIGFDCVTPL